MRRTNKIESELLKRIEHIEKQFNCKVLYIGLYGSQNYSLDDEHSDIDTKVIILPSLRDIIARKETSVVIDHENGQSDVKDILTYSKIAVKGNFNFLEPFYSKYWFGDGKIRDMFQKVPFNFMNIYGAMLEKFSALRRPYPKIKDKIDKYGFDPKQFHHIVRLGKFLEFSSSTDGWKHLNAPFIDYGKNENYISQEEGKMLLSLKRDPDACAEFLERYINSWKVKLNYNLNEPETFDWVLKTYINEHKTKYIKLNYKCEPIDIKEEVIDYILSVMEKNS